MVASLAGGMASGMARTVILGDSINRTPVRMATISGVAGTRATRVTRVTAGAEEDTKVVAGMVAIEAAVPGDGDKLDL